MNFSERTHAYIAAKFYVYLTEEFGERGKKAFVHGTQYHAEQRGRRMAQLAIRNGEELTYETYGRYGEWVNTRYTIDNEWSNQSKVAKWDPDLVTQITRCPWHTQFKEMGIVEGGHVYCEHLDNSICRGFNPYITYEVPQTLHKSECCIHIIRDAGITPETDRAKRPEGLQSFEYHTANSFWSYREVAIAIFEADGEQVAARVLADFANDYGKEMADRLMAYRDVNYNVVNN